ncbi:MAG: tRNA 2-thiouridine(34) synthase MnmA [Deltaproteobacteria bacterium]|nr:tRNA 2-thiouridine(34) synthase MnmA [Deltaproteobacteria bacterium]
MRVLVAMSGGVDSSVAAAVLRDAGHQVIGVTLHLWDAPEEERVGRCCSPEDQADARRVCDHLGVPHYVIDETSAFRAHVVDDLVRAYGDGITPAPCVRCNQGVKLPALVALANAFGAERIATGHYARVVRRGDGAVELHRARDGKKDQSYFLFGLDRATLERLELPLSDVTKDESRAIARRAGLPNADKGDSQELCFVPDGDVGAFVERQGGGGRAGVMRDADGRRLGTHAGVHHFTIGQRRGLGLGGGASRYVLRIVPDTGEVVVGSDDALLGSTLVARDARWCGDDPPREPFEADVRIRYRHAAARATVTPAADGCTFDARFLEPQRAITPGQAAVVYDGTRVVGGGVIVGAAGAA